MANFIKILWGVIIALIIAMVWIGSNGCSARTDVSMSVSAHEIQIEPGIDSRFDYQVMFMNKYANYLDWDRRSDRLESMRYIFEKYPDCQKWVIVNEYDYLVADRYVPDIDGRKRVQYYIQVKCE